VGERQWPVKTKMFEFTGMASCCPIGLSSYWLMCLHGDSTWHPVTGHLNWHRVNGPLLLEQLKPLVYAAPVDNEEALYHRIVDACQTMRNFPGIFEQMRRSMMRRVEACVESRGGHFEHLL
jgi:hypothetical protein